jgi:hypothetical protein
LKEPQKPLSGDDVLSLVSYLIAAAMLIPFGWWLKSHRLFGFGDWVVSLFH